MGRTYHSGQLTLLAALPLLLLLLSTAGTAPVFALVDVEAAIIDSSLWLFPALGLSSLPSSGSVESSQPTIPLAVTPPDAHGVLEAGFVADGYLAGATMALLTCFRR